MSDPFVVIMNNKISLNQEDQKGQGRFLILIFGVLTPLSAIFQLYHGDQF